MVNSAKTDRGLFFWLGCKWVRPLVPLQVPGGIYSEFTLVMGFLERDDGVLRVDMERDKICGFH